MRLGSGYNLSDWQLPASAVSALPRGALAWHSLVALSSFPPSSSLFPFHSLFSYALSSFRLPLAGFCTVLSSVLHLLHALSAFTEAMMHASTRLVLPFLLLSILRSIPAAPAHDPFDIEPQSLAAQTVRNDTTAIPTPASVATAAASTLSSEASFSASSTSLPLTVTSPQTAFSPSLSPVAIADSTALNVHATTSVIVPDSAASSSPATVFTATQAVALSSGANNDGVAPGPSTTTQTIESSTQSIAPAIDIAPSAQSLSIISFPSETLSVLALSNTIPTGTSSAADTTVAAAATLKAYGAPSTSSVVITTGESISVPSDSQDLSSTKTRTIALGVVFGGLVFLGIVAALIVCFCKTRHRRANAEPEWAMKYNHPEMVASSAEKEQTFAPALYEFDYNRAHGYSASTDQGKRYMPPSQSAWQKAQMPADGYMGNTPRINAPPPARSTRFNQTRVPPPRSPLATVPPIIARNDPEMVQTTRSVTPFSYGNNLAGSGPVIPPTPNAMPATPSGGLYAQSQAHLKQPAPAMNPFSPVSIHVHIPPRTPAPNTPLPATPSTPWSAATGKSSEGGDATPASTYEFDSMVEHTLGYGWTNGAGSTRTGVASLVGVHPFSAAADSEPAASGSKMKGTRAGAQVPAISEKAALAALDRIRDTQGREESDVPLDVVGEVAPPYQP
ncbi:hypothetical protein HMN09_01094600 [Mycena chlorophos]|uniref:Uncharacterized protein n=1 Tax=Mycena chlorophos TaxID=658473 RepID=A0A8H6VZQ6_MYCCL|nr:hypothetical protein HMN09_01094600 [Mycena chlorophos]